MLDDGRLTDGQGHTVDFKNTLIVMTSNIGSEYLANQKEGEDTDAARPYVMAETRWPSRSWPAASATATPCAAAISRSTASPSRRRRRPGRRPDCPLAAVVQTRHLACAAGGRRYRRDSDFSGRSGGWAI